MPILNEIDFANMIEPILLLDTINRICFNMTPYRMTKTKVEPSLLDRERDNYEVPPILVQKKHGNIVFEKDKHNPYVKSKENFHPRLTYTQIKVIEASATVLYLMPLQTVMY
jgi:hypothetical protein